MDEYLAKADRLNGITQRVGFALWQLQELEGVTATYFVLIAQAKPGMGREADALLEAALGRTFGSTINAMSKVGMLSAELDRRLRALLAERNWLVHNSRATSRGAVHSDVKAAKLIERIDTISEEALQLLRRIGALCESQVRKLTGMTRGQIDANAAALLKQWQEGD